MCGTGWAMGIVLGSGGCKGKGGMGKEGMGKSGELCWVVGESQG